MAKFSSKHKDRTQDFFIKSFAEGLNQDKSPYFLPTTALSRCKNLLYVGSKGYDGSDAIILRVRQGTEKISTTALATAMTAETYYIADSHYITATDAEVYELNSGTLAHEKIGDINGNPTFTEFHGKLIVHDGTVTKAWNGTTFETLNNLITDEIIGTGNGSAVDFTGTLDFLTIKTGSLTITYMDGTTKTITDDGAGALIGDVNAGGTNTIGYVSGAFSFKCSGAPDSATSIYATYEQVAGAPKSKAGFVRSSRLYTWGNSDNPSRLSYTSANDEDAWHSSSGGGYIDINALDGTDLVGCVNFYNSIVVIKENSLYRITGEPGDTDFRAEPLMENLGSMAYKTCLSDGNMISFLSKQGWVGLGATTAYGDITKAADISKNFKNNALQKSNQYCYADYNQHENQLWVTLYEGAVQGEHVHVISLSTGGQLSIYEFKFGHRSYKFVNGEMLIGGADGNLYKMSINNENFQDNNVSYGDDTYFRGPMTNWGLALNRKHNKKMFLHMYGQEGISCTFKLYTNNDYANEIFSKAIAIGGEGALIWGDDVEIFGDDVEIAEINYGSVASYMNKKFNYSEIMYSVSDIVAVKGGEFYGLDFSGAIIGTRGGVL